MIPGILMNLGLQGCTLMFASMTADLCDEDERVTGLRREGAYAAMAGFLSKLAGVLMMGMSGLIPWLVGYHAADRAPTAAQLLNMKWILIAAQGGIVLIALLFILLYPLTRERALETRRVLDARKRTC
jgi:GPH family glycoside/pentoside/hexuronide:cation symporter